MELPVFGSMMDDIWGIDELPYERPIAGSLKASEIVERVAGEWPKIGLGEHPDKTHVEVFGEEVQGLFVHPTDGWIGVSVAKRAKLWAATMRVISFPRPSLRSVERIVGKLVFASEADLAFELASERPTEFFSELVIRADLGWI